jgi:hypothetical protein
MANTAPVSMCPPTRAHEAPRLPGVNGTNSLTATMASGRMSGGGPAPSQLIPELIIWTQQRLAGQPAASGC